MNDADKLELRRFRARDRARAVSARKKEEKRQQRAERRRQAWGDAPIKWRAKFTEFEVHAKLYIALQELGYKVRGSVKTADDASLDLVIFVRKKPVLVIEVKSKAGFLGADLHKKQIDRYRQYGLPVCMVVGIRGSRKLIAALQKSGFAQMDKVFK